MKTLLIKSTLTLALSAPALVNAASVTFNPVDSDNKPVPGQCVWYVMGEDGHKKLEQEAPCSTTFNLKPGRYQIRAHQKNGALQGVESVDVKNHSLNVEIFLTNY